jgi:hypothetical protein
MLFIFTFQSFQRSGVVFQINLYYLHLSKTGSYSFYNHNHSISLQLHFAIFLSCYGANANIHTYFDLEFHNILERYLLILKFFTTLRLCLIHLVWIFGPTKTACLPVLPILHITYRCTKMISARVTATQLIALEIQGFHIL